MPMMRRGPLDRYPVEWVLRQAHATHASGCVEFHAPIPITVFLDGGRICAAVRGIASEGDEVVAAARIEIDEEESRRRTVSILALALKGEGGWYYHDPLERRGSGGWRWDAASLLMEARVQTHGERSLSAWNERTVGLQVPGQTDVRIGADAWAIVVELAGSAKAEDLRNRLGWDPTRMVAALDELDRSGALPPPGSRPVRELTRAPVPHRPAPRVPLFDDAGAIRAVNAADMAAAVQAAEAVLADAAAPPHLRSAPTPDAVPPLASVPNGPDTPDTPDTEATEAHREPTPAGHHRGPLPPPPVLQSVGGPDDRRPRRRIGSRRDT